MSVTKQLYSKSFSRNIVTWFVCFETSTTFVNFPASQNVYQINEIYIKNVTFVYILIGCFYKKVEYFLNSCFAFTVHVCYIALYKDVCWIFKYVMYCALKYVKLILVLVYNVCDMFIKILVLSCLTCISKRRISPE